MRLEVDVPALPCLAISLVLHYVRNHLESFGSGGDVEGCVRVDILRHSPKPDSGRKCIRIEALGLACAVPLFGSFRPDVRPSDGYRFLHSFQDDHISIRRPSEVTMSDV